MPEAACRRIQSVVIVNSGAPRYTMLRTVPPQRDGSKMQIMAGGVNLGPW